ncbi:MAG: PTS sugar transporter subunit IIC [Desulfohalobium sp.]
MSRFAVNLGFFERPISVALIWGMATGQWPLAIGVGITFELFWMDLFPAGTYIPPHGQAATVYSLTIAHCMGMYRPWDLLPVVVVALVLAHCWVRLEYWHRHWQNSHYSQLLQSVRQEHGFFAPERFVARSLVQLFVLNGLVFFLLTQISLWAFEWLHPLWPAAPFALQWPHVWGVALLGAVAALRTKAAYAVWLTGLVLLTAAVICLPLPLFL